MLSLFSFRYAPPAGADADRHNLALVNAINDDGRIYLTQTRVDGRVAIRFQAGQFETEARDVDMAYRRHHRDCGLSVRSGNNRLIRLTGTAIDGVRSRDRAAV